MNISFITVIIQFITAIINLIIVIMKKRKSNH